MCCSCNIQRAAGPGRDHTGVLRERVRKFICCTRGVQALIAYLEMKHSPAKEHDSLWSVIVRQKEVGVQLLLGKAEGFR